MAGGLVDGPKLSNTLRPFCLYGGGGGGGGECKKSQKDRGIFSFAGKDNEDMSLSGVRGTWIEGNKQAKSREKKKTKESGGGGWKRRIKDGMVEPELQPWQIRLGPDRT